MKKCIFIFALSLILSISFGWNAIAQIPKEGTFSGTNTYSGTFKVFPIDKERFIMYYENTGVRVDDTGGGPFHKVATHNVGIQYFEKGVGRLRGYYSMIDKDGDKVVYELTETESKLGLNPVNGTARIIGGTGKFTGIQGDMDYTRQNVRPVADGTFQAISTGKGNWKLP
jgi:hypothetical protein